MLATCMNLPRPSSSRCVSMERSSPSSRSRQLAHSAVDRKPGVLKCAVDGFLLPMLLTNTVGSSKMPQESNICSLFAPVTSVKIHASLASMLVSPSSAGRLIMVLLVADDLVKGSPIKESQHEAPNATETQRNSSLFATTKNAVPTPVKLVPWLSLT